MGSNETATATTGGPRVIDVFDGNGAPSGPNCTIFSGVDRLADSLRDRSGVGWSPTPHARALGAPQRALDRNLWQIMVQSNRAQRTLLICMHRWKPPRVRRRRLPMSISDPKATPRDLQGPICPRQKCAIWTRWRPVPGKNANYPRAPSSRRSGLVGPYTTPPIVNYKYMTST